MSSLNKIAVLVATLLSLALSPSLALAQSFKSDVQIDFPNTITFYLNAEAPERIVKVILRYQVERTSLFDEFIDCLPEFEPSRKIETNCQWDLTKIGGIPPGAKIQYFWIIENDQGERWESPPQYLEFMDSRFSWQSLSQNSLTFSGYAGSKEFIQELLSSAKETSRKLEGLLGVKIERATFYIYDSAFSMQGARVFPREWEGGVTFSDYNTVILAIDPANLSWGKRAIAHELTHLASFYATLGGFSPIPTWFNEGLAVYMEGRLNPLMREALNRAIKEDKLISVRSLASPFPAGQERAILSYAQSYSLVDFLIKIGGKEKMPILFKALREGKSFEGALLEAYQLDIPGLERAWRQSLGLPPEDPPQIWTELDYCLIAVFWFGLTLITKRKHLLKFLGKNA